MTQAGKAALSPHLPLLQNLRTGKALLKLQCKRFATWHILKSDLTSHAVLQSILKYFLILCFLAFLVLLHA